MQKFRKAENKRKNRVNFMHVLEDVRPGVRDEERERSKKERKRYCAVKAEGGE